MAKKWIAMMLIACMGLAGGIFYLKGQSDDQGPEIIPTRQAVQNYNPSMSSAELLEGMQAQDDKDGDVTDSLTIESIYEVDDSNVVVVYVAKDESNNITKFKRSLHMDDYEKETQNDDSAQETASPEETADDVPTPEPTPEVLDEAALAAQTQESAADAMPPQSPRIYLTEYHTKVAVGTSLDLLSYVKDIQDDKDVANELWHRIQISGQVNTAVAGTYTCTFYVFDADGNMSNNAELTVVVE